MAFKSLIGSKNTNRCNNPLFPKITSPTPISLKTHQNTCFYALKTPNKLNLL